jgi:RHS repeat-associated protein
VIACVAVDLVFKATLAPAVLASTALGAGEAGRPVAPDVAAAAAVSTTRAAAAAATVPPPTKSEAGNDDVVPELWTPLAAEIVDAGEPLGAASLFDGDATTGFTAAAGKAAAVRLSLGAAREVVGLGVHGDGRAKLMIYAEDEQGKRSPITMARDPIIGLQSDHWAEVTPVHPIKTSALVVQWTASPGGPAAITELAVWVAGRAQQALAEAAIADRLVTELPENAVASTAAPGSASVARVTPTGPLSASFSLKLNSEPLLGRAFLVYEVEKKAHWTGVARSINGHVVRGGYRADAKGLGGVQVEEINPAWLRKGDNSISFEPTLREDGRGYEIRNVRVVSVPRGSEPVQAPGARTSLSDGDLSTGVGGPGMHAASISVRADREPAFLSFFLDKPTGGTLTVAGDGGWSFRKSQVNVQLDGRAAGWQTVPVAGMLPINTGELRIRVRGDKESTGHVSEARVHWFPALTSQAGLTVAYPLHGECNEHKTYVRGFAAGSNNLEKPQLFVDGAAMVGKIDADGSFEAEVQEPAASKGKPWSIHLDVATEGGGHRTRTVPVDRCIEPPTRRIIGVSPPVEDVGAPYGAVVSPQKASTLSFGGATIEIPAGAVESDVRVTMRALDRAQVPPVQAEMENVTASAGALRFGPHGLKFKKPVKVTLPIDAARLPQGMTSGDVVAFFFDEASGTWTQLPKVLSRSDLVIAQTTHFTDFIASTIRTPDHPDAQQFNPNTMKGVKAGEPGAGITLIEPPQANSRGSASLSYPIETPPGRNGIGPHLNLTYDSDRVNTNGWLGVGWDLRISSIEVDTRFGVSRYDGTEVYTLDGAMLAPTGTAGTYIRRVESSFDLITRQGNDPTSYSWTVTDKSGTVYTYGTVANSRLANPRSGQPGFGNIFRWYLEKVQDPYGNTMTITYQHDASLLPPSAPTENGDEVYLASIDYTSNGSVAANYHVTFSLDAVGTRPDSTITARPGFLVATRQRLTDIKVKSGTTLVRQYHFDYQQDVTTTLQKSVLADVALWGVEGDQTSELYRHTFAYSQAPATTAMFAPQQTWGQVSQAGTNGYVPRTDNGLSHSVDNLVGGSISIGGGFPWVSASGSFGGDVGFSGSDLGFLNLTGEGLPDQVDLNGTLNVNYLPVAHPTDSHLFPRIVTGLPLLDGYDSSGFTAGGSISAMGGIYGGGVSYARHVTDQDTVVTDMNGDGFPDVVHLSGGAFYAYLNDGNRNFNQTTWSNYSIADSPFSTAARVDQAAAGQAFFKTDPLMRWVAPFGGTVTVNATAVGLGSTGDDLSVELYLPNDPTVRSATISAGDPNVYTLASNIVQTVNPGDLLYVRVKASGDGVSDGAQVSTSIAYTPPTGRSASEVDPTGYPIFSFRSGEDIVTSGQPNVPWQLTGDGDIGVARCFYKHPTSDDVKVAYVFRDRTGKIDTSMPTVAWTYGAAASSDWTAPFPSPLCVSASVLPPVSSSDSSMSIIPRVPADDSVALEITSDSPVAPSAMVVYPMSNGYTMSYTRYCRSGACGVPQKTGSGYTLPGDPNSKFLIPGKDITYGSLGDTDTRPYYQTQVWKNFYSGSNPTPQPIRSVPAPSPSVFFGGSARTTVALTEDALVLVQGVNKLFFKVRIPKGTPAGTSFPVSAGPYAVTSGEPIFFTIYSPTVIGGNLLFLPSMNFAAVSPINVNKAIQDANYDNNPPVANTTHDPMSGGFRHWFYGDWNDSVPFAGSNGFPSAINRTNAFPQNTDPVMGMIPCEQTQLLPWDDTLQYFRYDRWQGRGGAQLVYEPGSFNAIPGRVNDSAAIAGSAASMADLRVSDTWNINLTTNAGALNAGVNGGDSTTQVDFFDLNGDRYPDSITRSGISYNDGVGTFSDRLPVDAGFGELRKTINASLQAGVAVTTPASRQLINEADGAGITKKISATANLGVSLDYGVNSTRVDFADVNGDGLVDHVLQDDTTGGTLMVKLNLGYGFSNPIPWGAVAGWSQKQTSFSISALGGADAASVLGFTPNTPTMTDVVRLQDTGTSSATVGGSLGFVGGGGGPTWSVTRRWVDLIDVNGDGLPDQVLKAPGDPNLRVKLNKGDGFAVEQSWSLPNWTTSTGGNYSFMAPDGLGFSTVDGWGKNISFQVCWFVCFGASGFTSDSSGGPSADFVDIDGDGKPDQVMKVPGDANVYWKQNNIGQTNLLVAVTRPLGGAFGITYARAGNHVDLTPNLKMNMPSNQWAMASVTLLSGAFQRWNASTTQNFDYGNGTGYASGYFDPVERENYGYANVKTIFPLEDAGGTSIARTYLNQNYYLRGLESSYAAYQNDSAQVLLQSTADFYDDPSGKDAGRQPARTGTFFPAPTTSYKYFFEASNQASTHEVLRTFDTSGNLTDVVDVGDVEFFDPSDDFNYHIDYQHPGTNITVPSAITVRTGQLATGGALLAKRTVGAFDLGGKPKTVTDVIVRGKDPTTGVQRTEASPASATWTFTYDAYGNVQTAMSPGLSANPSCPTCGHTLVYSYDVTTQTYPVFTSWADSDQNAAYGATTNYDLRFGLPTRIIDVAGAKQEIDYDNYGRITNVFAPSDFDSSGNRINPQQPTIGVTYSEMPHTAGATEVLPAWARATHLTAVPREGDLPGSAIAAVPLNTVNFVDGLKRSIQVKKDITRDDGSGNLTAGMSISGRTAFDSRGRVYQQGQPSFAAGTGNTSFVSLGMIRPTQYAYDVLGRLRQEQHPDNGTQALTTISYQMGNQGARQYRLKITTDPLDVTDGNHFRWEYSTVRDDMMFRYEQNFINGSLTGLTTSYTYDQLGRVITVSDPVGNVTTANYDTVGNLVKLISPDAGTREWRYCVGGYVCAEQSPNMRLNGGTGLIQYTYDRDRLKTITYPNAAPNPPHNPIGNPSVTYVYGTAGEKGSVQFGTGYKANRVKQRTDEAGTFTYDYDALGNVASETAQLTSQIAGKTYPSYQTQYKWDNFGRLIDVTIPGTASLNTPAETIRYGYDGGGAVTSARGKLTASPNTIFDYVTHVGYNEFGERVRIAYGNQVVSTYGYASDTRRLTNANTHVQDAGGSRDAQALVYSYDLNGNLKSRLQNLPLDGVGTEAVNVGGISQQWFTYDPLNQLIHADLYNRDQEAQDLSMAVDINYDAIGNISFKNVSEGGTTYDPAGNQNGSFMGLQTYSLTPTYSGSTYNPSPHAPSSVLVEDQSGDTPRGLSYDANGNRTGAFNNITGGGLYVTWSDTDRVRSICTGIGNGSNCATIAQSLYTADGTRTHNLVTQGTTSAETLYVNQFLTVRDGIYPTKHVYLGDARVASKVETGAATNTSYWYHSDNIQSTQYVTTAGQVVTQHLEYLPGGEIWRAVEKDGPALLSNVAHATTFTGKELDASGYYYFGARYYDPQVQMWLSPDPILASYMTGKGTGGGVFFPRNLGLYTYSINNPIVLRDPDGRDWFPVNWNPMGDLEAVRQDVVASVLTTVHQIENWWDKANTNMGKGCLEGQNPYGSFEENVERGIGQATESWMWSQAMGGGASWGGSKGQPRVSPAPQAGGASGGAKLFRGVPGPQTARGRLGQQGIVEPRGTALDAASLEKHVRGEPVNAGVTSWTPERKVAKRFSGSDGTIIEVDAASVAGKVVPRPPVPKYPGEKEVLLKGRIVGNPTKP